MPTYPRLDPELTAAAAAFPGLDLTDLVTTRRLVDESSAASLDGLSYAGVDVRELLVPGPDGAPDVPVRLLTPAGESGIRPVLVAFHGGGWVLGQAKDFEYFCLPAVRELGIAVVNVEYRSAPESPFPAAVDDGYAVLQHLRTHGADLGVDPARIAVGGSSAGGGIAAGIALKSRDESGPPIVFQLLISPGLDDRFSTDSWQQYPDGPIIDRRFCEQAWRHYLGAGYGGTEDPDVSAYAVPARATDLTRLPPAYLAVMELDPLRDANLQYALRLLGAGVGVELQLHPGTFHGSTEMVPSAQVSIRALDGMVDALGRGLGVGAGRRDSGSPDQPPSQHQNPRK